MTSLIDERLAALEAEVRAQQLRLRVIERHLEDLRRCTIVMASPKSITKAAVNG